MPGHGHRVGFMHDLEEAKRLLAEAGYPNGHGLPTVELTVVRETLGVWIDAALKRMDRGIKAQDRKLPREEDSESDPSAHPDPTPSRGWPTPSP